MNTALMAAIQLAGGRISMNVITPEQVLLGYAKLLTMPEMQLKDLLGGECDEELRAARIWFDENKLDLKLIKSGLALVNDVLCDGGINREQIEKFRRYLIDTGAGECSTDILEQAKAHFFPEFTSIFHTGNDIGSVFAYADLQRAKNKEQQESAVKPEPESSGESAGAAESGSESGQNAEHPDDSGNLSWEERVKRAFVTGPKSPGESSERDSEEQKDAAPVKKMDLAALADTYRRLTIALSSKVKGQEHAILKFVQGYNQGELLQTRENRDLPKSYFFFFGPPGVGKTYLAQQAAKAIGIPIKVFNMSEYSEERSVDELIGIAKNYQGAREGQIIEFVQEHPKCLLLFDEIEKAHLHVIRLFLQVLGSGRLRSQYSEEEVTFGDTTIIFTSNVGKELYDDRSVNLTTLPEKVLIDSIQREKNSYGQAAMPPEMCSRIAAGNTVLFNHLSIRHLIEIVRRNFDAVVDGMEKEYDVKVTYPAYLPQLFIYNRGGEIDARVASSQSGKFLKNELYELLRQMENSKNPKQKITSIDIDVEWEGMDPELRRLFVNDDKAEVLVFAEGTGEVFRSVEGGRYTIRQTADMEQAREWLKRDIAAVFIDPFQGKGADNEQILSIADYNTDGVQLFHELAETQASMPIYMLEKSHSFSPVDQRTFLQEGAAGTLCLEEDKPDEFADNFNRTMEDLYMERESTQFTQRGWVIGFGTKQEVAEDGSAKIRFYALKKRMAVDVESRGSILSAVERPKVKFDDIIGAQDAKEELKYFLEYLKNPRRFLTSGGKNRKPPKGILLYGPPGTGKTMLAKAMAGESDVTFLQTSASEFKNQFVGESEENIRRIFRRARRYAPAIVFIDEIDAIGKKRSGTVYTNTEDSMLNTLLTEMDGFSSGSPTKPVFVLAATNFAVRSGDGGIGGLDEALIRRFDNKIYVDLPNEEERCQYLTMMLSRMGISEVTEDTIRNVAERTTGQSLAILQNVLEAAEKKAQKEGTPITDEYLLDALEYYIYGEKRENPPEYYRKVAIHETGHAVISYLRGDKPSYITIESRGDFGGYMQHANQENVQEYTREDYLGLIRTCLAGRAAEQIFFGKKASLNTGASSDLRQATNYAFHMLCTFGMMEDSFIVLSRDEIMKSALAGEYVAKVNAILNTEMKNTIVLLQENREKVEEIARILQKENRLTGEQFEKLMEE